MLSAAILSSHTRLRQSSTPGMAEPSSRLNAILPSRSYRGGPIVHTDRGFSDEFLSLKTRVQAHHILRHSPVQSGVTVIDARGNLLGSGDSAVRNTDITQMRDVSAVF